MFFLNCNHQLIDLSTPKIMGILNLTPDSFYDGGKYKSDIEILRQTEKMLQEGATFIDIGAYSSRPGAKVISEKEEYNRLIPVIQLLLKKFPNVLLSIDTFRSKIATESIANGACIINDISAGKLDLNMFKTIAQLQVPYIIMHMQGTPQNMQQNPTYQNIINDLLYYFSKKINELRNLGVNDIIADVGFGFGKTIEHNYKLLANLELFKNLKIPLLTGLSRKSMLYKPLEITADLALNATTSVNTISLLKGANLLRVHDVKEAKEAIDIVNLVNQNL